jgi:hypothetical protein
VHKSGPTDTITAAAAQETGTFGWRRQRYLVDARYQLRVGFLVGIVALVLLILLNLSMFVQDRSASTPAGVSIRHLVGGKDPASFALLVLGSAAFLGGVVLIGMLESHRTAGAAFAIRRAVDSIREGRPQIRVRLRRGDHLQDLARSINQLAETIDSERTRRG